MLMEGEFKHEPCVFVLMPFEGNFDDIYEFGIKATAVDLLMKCERVDEIEFNGVIHKHICESIEQADIIIADITGGNPNVTYEVGYAHAQGKIVILLVQNVKDIPFDLQGFNHIVYPNITILKRKLKKRLQKVCDSYQ